MGDLPPKDIPLRIGVAGTPLVVQKERVLTKGLRGRMWRTGIEYGQLPVSVPLERTFHVFNTGGLDMRLTWQLLRFQDGTDASRPGSKLLDVTLKVVDAEPAAEEEEEEGGPWPAASSEQQQEEVDGTAAAVPAAPTASQLVHHHHQRVVFSYEAHAAEDDKPFVVEPAEKVGRRSAIVATGIWHLSSHIPRHTCTIPIPWRFEGGMGAYTVPPPTRSSAPLLPPLYVPSPSLLQGDQAPLPPQVIKGGDFAKFTVRFSSARAALHAGYLIGKQEVQSAPQPISLKVRV